MTASVAASVAPAQCEPGRTDREDGGGRHLQLQMSSAASVRALESASSSNSSLTSGYSSPADLTDKRESCHSRPSNGNTTTRETFGNDAYSSSSSSSSIPRDPPPCSSEKNCQCFSELPSQSRVDSSPLAPSSRQRKVAVSKLSQAVSNTLDLLVGDGSVHSSMQSPDARLQVTDLVMSDSDDEDDDDDVGGGELYSCKLRLGYPFTDEAVSESDCETDSSHGSHSNSRRSSVSHWN